MLLHRRRPDLDGRAAILAAVSFLIVSAFAAQPVTAADVDKAEARAHFEAASRLYDVKEFAKALEEYKAAYLAKPDPAFLFNMGQCYRKLGKNDQALDFYREYLKKAAADDPNRPGVEARVRDMEAAAALDDQTRVPGQGSPATLAAAQGPAPTPGATAPNSVPIPAPASATERPAFNVTETNEQKAPSQPRFYRTWWFWTGVGASVVAATVIVAIAASGGKHTNTADTALGTQGAFQ